MSIHTQTADNIKAIRTAMDWTQHELAERCGLTQKSIGAIEEARMPPNADLLRALERLVRVGPAEVLHGSLDPHTIAAKNGREVYDKVWFRAAIDHLRSTGRLSSLTELADRMGLSLSLIYKVSSEQYPKEPSRELVTAFRKIYSRHLPRPLLHRGQNTVPSTIDPQVAELKRTVREMQRKIDLLLKEK